MASWVFAGLLLAAFGAGWINAVVGGGGLIMLPSLLVGLPAETPIATIAGTNKTAQVVGNLTAGVGYLSLIHISEPTRPRFGSRMPSSA